MLNNTYEENVPIEVREIISFTYETITWTLEGKSTVRTFTSTKVEVERD